ncbi:MAG: hypothetical protein LUG15_06655, partial [Oscillospiraceae bacterium]|nr:hypothetical protein [Oscillospiraceae bacterium]
GWMLRTVTEGLLGLRMRGGLLYVEPNLPAHWSGYTVICRGRRIEVFGSRVTIDGRLWDGRGVHMDAPHS